MRTDPIKLEKILDKIKNLEFLVVGDLILDKYIWGNVERISQEAPVPVLEITKNENRLGGGGNIIKNLRNLGVKVTACGLVGDDIEKKEIINLLKDSDVSTEGIFIDKSRPTTIKTRIIAKTQQLVRIDREEKTTPNTDLKNKISEFVSKSMKSVDGIIIADYGKGVINSDLLTLISEARKNNKIGLKVKPVSVDPSPANHDLYQGISIAKPNRKEAEKATGIKITDQASARRAGQILREKWNCEMVLISLGEDGLSIFSTENPDGIFVDTVAREVFDVSGAGDTVTSVFTAAIAAGADSLAAGELANLAAGIVVSEVGTVPIRRDQLDLELNKVFPGKKL